MVSKTRGRMSVDSETVVLNNEQKEKQNHDSAFGTSESPEKQAKEAAKKPVNLTERRPSSFPSTAGDRVKDDRAPSRASTRPHSYPNARPTTALSALPPLRLTCTVAGLAMIERRMTQFSCVQREYTHDIVMGLQFVETLPHSTTVSMTTLDKI